MSWFRLSSLVFTAWGVVFTFFPHFANKFGGVGYTGSTHAEDWTQLVGLFSLAFAVLLDAAHRSPSADLRRAAARTGLVLTVPSAALMSYWQLIPNRLWLRLDIVDILLLILMSFGLFKHSGLWSGHRAPPETEAAPSRPDA